MHKSEGARLPERAFPFRCASSRISLRHWIHGLLIGPNLDRHVQKLFEAFFHQLFSGAKMGAALIKNVAVTGVAFVMSALVHDPAHATFVSGNTLYEYCTAEKGSSTYYQDNAYCSGYVIGAVDAMEVSREINKKPQCVPTGATRGQVVAVFMKWINDHPEARSYDASALVTIAISTGFRCQ